MFRELIYILVNTFPEICFHMLRGHTVDARNTQVNLSGSSGSCLTKTGADR